MVCVCRVCMCVYHDSIVLLRFVRNYQHPGDRPPKTGFKTYEFESIQRAAVVRVFIMTPVTFCLSTEL